MIKLIWAEDRDHVIGKNNRLPWRLKNDLKHFKQETLGLPVIMGRKTWESIGFPLPNRVNIILSTQKNWQPTEYTADVRVFHTIADVRDWLSQQQTDAAVIGGAAIYEAFFPYAGELIVTHVDCHSGGDVTVAPASWQDDFYCVSEQTYAADADNDHAFTIRRYQNSNDGDIS